ncbi:MAG: hypothetical protein LBI39_02035 [Puniceicoccales bacterium]|nr:hypothetical protein [Puniceicoccales bacterium]
MASGFCDNQRDRVEIMRQNMVLKPSEVLERFVTGTFRRFVPGWVIVADKPSGVEGGFIVRRLYEGDLGRFPVECPEGFAQLQAMSVHGHEGLPQQLWADSLGGLSLVEAYCSLDEADKRSVAALVLNSTDAFRKSIMVKVLFGMGDVNGTSANAKYFKPRPKNAFHRMITGRTVEQVNGEVLREKIANEVARAVDERLAPRSALGKVDGNRFFIGTEMVGGGEDGSEFIPIGACGAAEFAYVDCFGAALSYAVTVGLLGDRDANKDGNVGLYGGSDDVRFPVLIDLGHPEPNRFALNPVTLLPYNVSNGSMGFYLGRMNGPEVGLTVDVRALALREVCAKKYEIHLAIQSIKNSVGANQFAGKVIDEMDREIEVRIKTLERVLHEHDHPPSIMARPMAP